MTNSTAQPLGVQLSPSLTYFVEGCPDFCGPRYWIAIPANGTVTVFDSDIPRFPNVTDGVLHTLYILSGDPNVVPVVRAHAKNMLRPGLTTELPVVRLGNDSGPRRVDSQFSLSPTSYGYPRQFRRRFDRARWRWNHVFGARGSVFLGRDAPWRNERLEHRGSWRIHSEHLSRRCSRSAWSLEPRRGSDQGDEALRRWSSLGKHGGCKSRGCRCLKSGTQSMSRSVKR
jgi:hypothetical protein